MIDYALRPASKKITLVELDIGQQQVNWTNSAAGMWYWIFSLTFPLVDPSLLAGLSAQTVGTIGSLASDSAQLLSVPDAATCQTTERSFFYDQSVTGGALYIHLQNGDEPSLHSLMKGVVYGVANQAGIYNNTYYDGRLVSAPAISKTKDPLFFGRISFDGGWIVIDNEDGYFDRAGENLDLFGNAVRIFQGFDDQPFMSYVAIGRGLIENVRVGPDTFEVLMTDPRKAFSRAIPNLSFDATAFPFLKPDNVGKAIPLAYGTLKNVPCVCTNETQSGPPANYTFKICDCTYHAIKAITTVYVKGIAKATSASDLTQGTFSLANANYTAGDVVTADIQGYVDAGANFLQNSLDVIQDLLLNYQFIPNIPNAYNQGEWASAQVACPVIALWQDSPKELYSTIEDICTSARVGFIPMDDGRLTARKYSPSRGPSQVIPADILLEVPAIEYDPTEVLSSTRVGYAKDWGKGTLTYLADKSQEAAIFAKYKVMRERQFDTLLTTLADAQAFSTDILLLSAVTARKTKLRMKMQAIGRDVMEFVQATINRQSGESLLGDILMEISGVTKDLVAAEITLDGRIVTVFPPTIYVQGGYWGDGYWGDEVYSRTELQEVG
jgi:hypothetical protein